MSHGKLRHEKNCLNCGSIVKGPYCHICGQHNVVPQESVWDLVSHFVYDITHFDGKFFKGIKFLLLKPGFLSKEYKRGRRAAHINPVRFYVFTSAFFFVIFFSIKKNDEFINFGPGQQEVVTRQKRLHEKLGKVTDSAEYDKIVQDIRENDTLIVLYESMGLIEKSNLVSDAERDGIKSVMEHNTNIIGIVDKKAKTIEQYDSLQQALPKKERDGWLMQFFKRKSIQINKKYMGRADDFRENFSEKFLHSIPKMMFVSLPLVAFFLWLLYARKKKYYYANHAILVIHDYIAIYLIFLLVYLVRWLSGITHWAIFNLITGFLILYCFYYVYKSMRVFYEENRGKTFLKFFIFSIMVFVMFALLSVIFVINTMINV